MFGASAPATTGAATTGGAADAPASSGGGLFGAAAPASTDAPASSGGGLFGGASVRFCCFNLDLFNNNSFSISVTMQVTKQCTMVPTRFRGQNMRMIGCKQNQFLFFNTSLAMGLSTTGPWIVVINNDNLIGRLTDTSLRIGRISF